MLNTDHLATSTYPPPRQKKLDLDELHKWARESGEGEH